MSATKLWGWLSPDHADPLDNAPLAQAMLAKAFELDALPSTPPVPLDPDSVPQSRMTKTQLAALQKLHGADSLSVDRAQRAMASLGQSCPDQLLRRAGRVETAVDAVVWPKSHEQAQALLDCASQKGFRVVAVGGATSVVGGLKPPGDKRPLVAASLSQMNEVVAFSAKDMKVTAEAGIALPALEEWLGQKGLTLGHFPQSFEGATLGGSIAANGAGQRSDGYGRIGERLLQARLATPVGEWRTEPLRHSAAGPWLGSLVAGSEGLFGIVTEATMALAPKPQAVFDGGWLFPSFDAAVDAARKIAQEGLSVSMVRISDAAETRFLSQFRLARAGLERAPLIERAALALKRAPADPCLMLAGYEGSTWSFGDATFELFRLLRACGAISLGERPGKSWRKSRFETPHLREALMARGLGIDTYETATPWSQLGHVHAVVAAALSKAIVETSGRPGMVMCHLSHSYADAACLYFTAVFLRSNEALAQWRRLKHAATHAMAEAGATVSHHHGMGADHAAWASAEKGPAGIRLLQALARELDPEGVMATGMQAGIK